MMFAINIGIGNELTDYRGGDMEDFVEKRLDGFLAFIDRDLETIKDMVDSVRMNGGTPEKICIPSCKLFGLPIEFYDGGSVTVMATPTDQKDE